MLKPRFKWHCDKPGCCTFVGGTPDFDIYMGKCHERPWDPQVILLAEYGLDYEFDNAEAFAKHLEGMSDRSATEQEALGRALNFVHTFFPTPVRVAMDRLAKGEDL